MYSCFIIYVYILHMLYVTCAICACMCIFLVYCFIYSLLFFASVGSYYLQFWKLHPEICYDNLFLTKGCKFCFLLTVTQMLSNQNSRLEYKNLNYKYSLHFLFQEATCSECWSAWNNALLQVRRSSFIDWSKFSKRPPSCLLIYFVCLFVW